MAMKFSFHILAAYLIGSINVSVIVLRYYRKGDPRQFHSGNPGASNVYRIAGPFTAFIVVFLEMAKAIAVVLSARFFLAPEYIPWIGFFLVAGNAYPCFHRFKGGKGVSAYLGYSAGVSPLSAAISIVGWITGYAIAGEAFIGSFCLVIINVIGTTQFLGINKPTLIGSIAVAAFILFRHRHNIRIDLI